MQIITWRCGLPWWGLMAMLLLASCGRYDAEEGEEGTNGNAKTYELKMKLRSGSDVDVPLPIKLYIFNGQGELHGVEEIASLSETFKHSLPKGDYMLATFAGLGGGYDVPLSPAQNSFIALGEGTSACPTPLMAGKAQVALKQAATVTLTLSYVVSALDFTFTGMPDDATDVDVRLSPVSTGLRFDGSYRNDGSTLQFACKRQAGGWKSGTLYAFPSESNHTHLSITVQRPSGSETYGYTYRKALQAGQPYAFAGSYKEGVSIGGEFEVEGWKPTIDIEFDFDSQEGGEGQTPVPEGDVIQVNRFPQAGGTWKNCYVWRVIRQADGTASVTLIAPDHWKTLAGNASGHLALYEIDGLGGWRTFTADEAKAFRDDVMRRFDEVNKVMAGNAMEPLYRDKKERYLCNEAASTFCFYNDRVLTAGLKTNYYLRAVKVVSMQEK